MKAVRTSHKYKMIFSDIDGTLLNSSHQVPGPTRRKILELEREGVPFVLVSARMPEGMTTIQAMIGCRAPMVCYSGAWSGMRMARQCTAARWTWTWQSGLRT